MAKEALHLKYEDIYRLCREAPSAAPVECMLKLDSRDRAEAGYSICSKAASSLPSECFQRVMSHATKVSRKAVAEFCHGVVDYAPILCTEAARDHTTMKVEDILPICKDAVGSGNSSASNTQNHLVANCITTLKHLVSNANGVAAKDVLEFCAHINPNQYHDFIDVNEFSLASVNCVEELSQKRKSMTLKLTQKDIFSICLNAPTALGPVNCSISVAEAISVKEPSLKLTSDAIATLCRSAVGTGPIECFVESRGLGSQDERAHLCHSAVNSGPALCYRRSASSLKQHPEERFTLCVVAESEGPAECVAAAPHYLVAEEKVHLCTAAPVGAYTSPIQCLQAVHTYSKNFQNAPKRALGYFQENLQLDTEWTSRALLVSLCSFSDSQDPLAAAECYKSVPTSLHHDDAVRLCTNISSSQAIQHIQLCQRILPRSWNSEAVSVLCEGLSSRHQTESVVKCAVEVTKMQKLSSTSTVLGGLSDVALAHLCRSEAPASIAAGSSGGVLKCLQRLSALPSSAANVLVDSHTASSLCSGARNAQPADCMHSLANGLLSAQQSVKPDVAVNLCLRDDATAIITCLGHVKNKRLLDENDVIRCAETKREIASIRVQRVYSLDISKQEEESGTFDPTHITSGKRFAVWFDVRDQWNEPFDVLADSTSGSVSPLIKISINEQNAQGAILWGYRLNTTHRGVLHYASLIVSQAGPIQVKLTTSSNVNPASLTLQGQSGRASKTEKTLAVFQLQVHVDPVAQATAPCLYVLQQGVCPFDFNSHQDGGSSAAEAVAAADHDRLFPFTRASFPTHTPANPLLYLQNLYCADETRLLGRWGVRSYILADASLHVEYRLGIDAIWTGVGLPRQEMAPAQKLGLVLPPNLHAALYGTASSKGSSDGSPAGSTAADSKQILKLLKRAYYRASLQWHPDRWAGLDQYTHIVQNIFQQVTEAYDALQQVVQSRSVGSNREAQFAEEPVYA